MQGLRHVSGSQLSLPSNSNDLPPVDTNLTSFNMLRHLYTHLETQLCKSYRPHVVYVPSSESESKNMSIKKEHKGKKKFKGAQIAIETVNHFEKTAQIRRMSRQANDLKSPALDDKLKSQLELSNKPMSKSLPNLSAEKEENE
ncbi:hypothetical protein CHS0354_029527 [Potamilus streckersoni]|uniref:Uncharacterized protein n=1 Tax=Potamilus streckersoni TaxID=2493646 RepID=A0AAE0W412_9BIVA|nr:hypothetical protein CHS0354_029527 [Potamilus streckersoni]